MPNSLIRFINETICRFTGHQPQTHQAFGIVMTICERCYETLAIPKSEPKRPHGQWICALCGQKYGNYCVFTSTFHPATCDYCGLVKNVTSSRDYGYPELFKREATW